MMASAMNTLFKMTAFALWLLFSACGTTPRKPVAETAEKPVHVAAVPESKDSRPVIAAFGDSLTAGFGAEPGNSYPDYLQKLIDSKGLPYRVFNAGVSGDTTTDGVERLSSVLALHPAIVILEFGGNDGLRGLAVESTRQNLDRMITGFEGTGAKVLLAGMTLPRNYGPDFIHSFETIYVDLAKEHHVARIPFLLLGVAGTKDMQQDGIHPTASGNARVAALVMSYLEPLLKKARLGGSRR